LAHHRFEIQYQSAPQAQPRALHATSDADEATVAFHAALSRLRERGAAGHVLMHKQNDECELLLRQPVNPRELPDESTG
jgi:hypothetical protein